MVLERFYVKRQLLDTEKQQVRMQQRNQDGSLKCFISGEVIGVDDEIEYDHLLAYAKQGDTDLSNIRIVKKEYNRRKKDQSLYEVRDNLKLENLFSAKKIRLSCRIFLNLKILYKKQ